MLPYVKIQLGDIPSRFTSRKRDFYKCLSFTALLIAQNRRYTGYKELNKVCIDADDLIWLGIIREPQVNGAYLVNYLTEVTYWHRGNTTEYFLDTFAFGRANVTDILMNKDSKWLYDEDAWYKYDVSEFNMLPSNAQKWFLKIINDRTLTLPASELLSKLQVKVRQSKQYDPSLLNDLPDDIKEWFLNKINRGYCYPSAQAILLTTRENWLKYKLRPFKTNNDKTSSKSNNCEFEFEFIGD